MKRIISVVCVVELIIIFIILSNFFTPRNDDALGMRGFESLSTPYITYYRPKANTTIKNYVFGEKTYKTNSDGIYSNNEYPIKKPKGTYRIITLGDSFTFGSYVDTKNNWPSLLEVILNNKNICQDISRIEVINLGVEGYDTRYSLERFKDKGAKYKPDLVLWMHTDLIRMNSLMRPLINQSLINGDSPQAAWENSRQLILKSYGIAKLYEIQRSIIESLDKVYSGKLGIISTSNIDIAGKDILKQVSNKRSNSFYIDIPDLRKRNALFPENIHPNEKGHDFIADLIAKYLVDNNIICDK